MTRSGAALRVSVSLAVLLAGLGSAPLLPSSWTEAVLMIWVTPAGMALLTMTVTVRVSVAPAATAPMFQVTTPPLKAPPSEALTKVVLAGSVSRHVTPVAPWLPLLVMVRV